jgi:molecular chaperone GrpE
MPDERRGAPAEAGGEPQVKVVDRRRFNPDGEPVAGGDGREPDPGRETSAEQAAGRADERDAKIAAQAARIDELSRAYASLVEDNKAFRQRLDRERARVVEAERVNVAQGLLEAADDLERALAAVSGAPEATADAVKSLADGVRLSLAAIQKRIAELGAERIRVEGERFDPHVAEAVDTVAVADAEGDGVVVQEVRSGYRIGERVIRPARVRVGRLARA